MTNAERAEHWLEPYRQRLERGELGTGPDGESPQAGQIRRAVEHARAVLPLEQLATFDEAPDRPIWDWGRAVQWVLRQTSEPSWVGRRGGGSSLALLAGSEGIGKTQGLVCGAIRLARLGLWVEYLPILELDVGHPSGAIARLERADVILLDDLHRAGEVQGLPGLVFRIADLCYRRRHRLLAAASAPIGSRGTAPTGLHRILGVEVVARFRYRAGLTGQSFRDATDTTGLADGKTP